jgi:hypothetical protein
MLVFNSNLEAKVTSSKQLTGPLDERMTTEQLRELGEALSILSAKSGVLKERDELRILMEENIHSEEVNTLFKIKDSFLITFSTRKRQLIP